MRKITTRISLAVLLICSISCSKDNNSTNSSALSGTWNFMGIHAVTSSTASDVEAGTAFKDVTTSDYTTTENGGTMSISGKTMTGTGITYSADMKVLVTQYVDNVITDTFSTSLPFVVPPTNSSSDFEVIGKDSIHYTGSNMLGSGASGSPAANGAKFSISGNTLTLTSSVVVDRIIDTLGTTITQHESATVVATLQKL